MQLPVYASPIQKCGAQQYILGFCGPGSLILSVLLFQSFGLIVLLFCLISAVRSEQSERDDQPVPLLNQP